MAKLLKNIFLNFPIYLLAVVVLFSLSCGKNNLNLSSNDDFSQQGVSLYDVEIDEGGVGKIEIELYRAVHYSVTVTAEAVLNANNEKLELLTDSITLSPGETKGHFIFSTSTDVRRNGNQEFIVTLSSSDDFPVIDGIATVVVKDHLPLGQLENVQEIFSGGDNNCALTTLSEVVCWGRNNYSQYGNGTVEDWSQNAPETVAALSTNIVDVSGTFDNKCVLTADSEILCWGKKSRNFISLNKYDLTTPAVSLVDTNIKPPIIVGDESVCYARVDGGADCYGKNNKGQLGRNYTGGLINDLRTPEPVWLLGGNIVQFATGLWFVCSLSDAGDVHCWGDNDYGVISSLGVGSNYSVPEIPYAISDVAQIAAGTSHVCALKNDGSVVCWGGNNSGQAGTNVVDDPVLYLNTIPGIPSNVVSLKAGGENTCVLLDTDEVYCWGLTTYNQLGPYQAPTTKDFAKIENLGSGIASLEVGNMNICVVYHNGTADCWGKSEYGQTGHGWNSRGLNFPVDDEHRLRDEIIIQKKVGYSDVGFGFVKVQDGSLYAWGHQLNGLLANGVSDPSTLLTPAKVWDASVLGPVVDFDLGKKFGCLLNQDGEVLCWGDNTLGTTGQIQATTEVLTPTKVLNTAERMVSLSVALENACSVSETGKMYCWGSDAYGQTGECNAALPGSFAARDITSIPNVTKVVVGSNITCGINTDGELWCLGENSKGQLGNSQIGPSTSLNCSITPSRFGVDEKIVDAAVTFDNICVLTESKKVYCSGSNHYGALGTTNYIDISTVPVEIEDAAGKFKKIAGSTTTICGIVESDGVHCWGANYKNQIPNGNFAQILLQQAVPEVTKVVGIEGDIIDLDVYGDAYCVTYANGKAKCWGDNQIDGVLSFHLGSPPYPTPVSAPKVGQ